MKPRSHQPRCGGGPIALLGSIATQALIYPVTNYAFDTASHVENAEGYLLTQASMKWFWSHYLPSPEHGRHPTASPLRAASLAGLPPALVITAEYDPLRDEGRHTAATFSRQGWPPRSAATTA